jgi:lipase chaperone LimK
MRKKRLLGAAVLLLTGVMTGLWRLAQDSPEPRLPPTATAPADNTSRIPVVATALSPDRRAALTASLIHALDTGPGGHLTLTPDTRRALDAFLQDPGNPADARMMAFAREQLLHTLQEPAAGEAAALLAQYAAYRQALAADTDNPALNETGTDSAVAAAVRLQRLGALRGQYLSPAVVQVFFADEDAYRQFQLARQRLLGMGGLTDDQRQEQIAALHDQLPPAVRDLVDRER